MEEIDVRPLEGYHYYYISIRKGGIYDSRRNVWKYPDDRGTIFLREGFKRKRVVFADLVNEYKWKALEECNRKLKEWNDEQEKKYYERIS